MLKQLPTCGRVVWYFRSPSVDLPSVVRRPIPAIVDEGWLEDGIYYANLNVLGPDPFYGARVPQCDAAVPVPGCWAWMPYQEAKAARPEGNQSESAERV